MIETYGHYTPEELRNILLGYTEDGDAHELHSALIVLCDLVARQQAKIDELRQRVIDLEHFELE